MAPPCKRYRKVYTWQVFSIRPSLPPWGVVARPAILENRGGKSHFCDYFIIRARYVYLSYYYRAYNSLHFLFFMFFCQINSFVVTECRIREFLLFLYFLFFSTPPQRYSNRVRFFLRSVPGGHSLRCSRSLLFYSF
jgi:hypothetical protein